MYESFQSKGPQVEFTGGMYVVGHFQEFEDEYLETMYEFYEQDPLQRVRTGDLASRLGVAPASATEMIQRLAARGYLEYIPYKGASLTESGLVHGQKMKRRHRLAEVLLESLPFDGNAHETACRLEHAIDDDLEVALSRLMGGVMVDPSGRPIPAPTKDIEQRIAIHPTSFSLDLLEPNQTGSILAFLLPKNIIDGLQSSCLAVGSTFVRDDEGNLIVEGKHLMLSEEWSKAIFVQLSME